MGLRLKLMILNANSQLRTKQETLFVLDVKIYETFKGNRTAIPSKNTNLTSPGMIIFYPN